MIALLAALGTAAAHARADDWPCWRGPRRDGISAETDWNDRWPPEGPPVAWKAEVGTGFSSFAVAGGRAFTMGHDDGSDTLFCFDAATGRKLWTHSCPSELGDRFFEGGPTSTPAVDGGRLYAFGRWGDLFCMEAATGRVLWSRNVQKEDGLPVPGWGFSGSPVVLESLLLLNAGGGGIALDKATGELKWKSSAREAGYSTPLPFRSGGDLLVALSTGSAYLAVDPLTGQKAWSIRWITQYGCNAADPVVRGDLLLISSGYGRGAALYRLGQGGPEAVWQSKVLRSQFSSSVLIGEYLYGVDGDTTERASLKCVEFATGVEKWALPGFGSGSVTAAGGRLIALDDRGELVVGPASPDGFKPAARAKILEGKCWTVPVLSGGRIYARNAAGDVVCLDVRLKAGGKP